MKRKCLSIFAIIMPMLLVACAQGGEEPNNNNNNDNPPEEQPTEMQYLLDPTFKEGFIVSPASGTRMDDGWFPEERWTRDVTLTYGDEPQTPCWCVAQHGDIYSLCDKYNKFAGNVPKLTDDGYYWFSDESKVLAPNPSKGSLYIELNTSKEYTRDRKGGEAWCHILLNQGFKDACRLKEVDSVIFTIDLLMKKFEDHTVNFEFNTHATQFLMYIVIKSEAAGDTNDFFWFGIPFFDNRYPNGLPESGMVDAGGAGGTGKYMYGMESAEYLPGGLKLNQLGQVNIDLLPYFGSALLKCQRAGFFTNSTINDLTFQSMNIGFEIPGWYDCGIEISNFSLTSHFKQA